MVTVGSATNAAAARPRLASTVQMSVPACTPVATRTVSATRMSMIPTSNAGSMPSNHEPPV